MKSRYDWTEEELLAEYESAKTNPAAIWSKDDYGQPIVSLLKTTVASNARSLAHKKGVSANSAVETDDVEEAFSSSLTTYNCIPH